MQPTTSLDELRRKSAKFMQLKQLRKLRNQARVEANGKKGTKKMDSRDEKKGELKKKR